MNAALPSRLRASFWATALTTSKRRVWSDDWVCGSPIQITKPPALLITSMTPPTRRAYSRRQLEPPKSPIETPSGTPVMYDLSSFPPKARTTARGRSSLTWARISSNQLKTSGRVRPVATRPSTPPTDSITGLDPAARTIAYPGVITSESPATQSFSFRSGVNATFLGFAGGVRLRRRARRRLRRGPRRRGRRLGERDLRVDLVAARPPDERLDADARPVEQQGVADVRERAGEGDRDVARPAVGLVVGGLVDPRRVQEEGDRQGEDRDDERVAGAPQPPARRLLVVAAACAAARAEERAASRAAAVRQRPARRGRLVLRQRGQGREGAVGHQNWK